MGESNVNVLVVIPARGGSKGIPRKNLRKLAGNPLIYYSIRTAIGSTFAPDVYVSSEDDEILSVARNLGAKVLKRDDSMAADVTTLDPVIHDACIRAEKIEGRRYDIVVTLQPTSPLLTSQSLDAALRKLIDDPDIDTVIAARSDAHLSWTLREGKFVPTYERRVNRQFLPPLFRETGGFLIARRGVVSPESRIGKGVDLQVLSGGEEIDIDSHDDWSLCEFHLRRRSILFVVTGNEKVGLGHVHNTLLVANDILNHHVEFLVDRDSTMARDEIASRNYAVRMQQSDDILDDIRMINPDVVVNDRLDTDPEYVRGLKELGLQVVNFEDLGDGARYADLVVNAIYPEKEALPRHYFGPEYFVLRDEFLLTAPPEVKTSVGEVLLTFGGVDPNNFTRKVLESIHGHCGLNGIAITIVTGFGYREFDSLAGWQGVEVVRNAKNISDYMARADMVFTSAGRTTYEVASLGIPCIVLAQNPREMTHFFASEAFGFAHLGMGAAVSAQKILETFIRISESAEARVAMSGKMRMTDLRLGRARVNALLNQLLDATLHPDPAP
jgi:CMP-N-acetylneuraminic acid synthetase/spore coat polysaccharide biosynthesis predicted glycosyltransferase SpsG